MPVLLAVGAAAVSALLLVAPGLSVAPVVEWVRVVPPAPTALVVPGGP